MLDWVDFPFEVESEWFSGKAEKNSFKNAMGTIVSVKQHITRHCAPLHKVSFCCSGWTMFLKGVHVNYNLP